VGKLIQESLTEKAMETETTSAPNSSLYKYVTIDVLRRVLAGTVRFTQPSAFNDPFELLPEIVMPVSEAERQINISLDILAPRRVPPVGELLDLPQGHASNDVMSRNIVQSLNDQIGILCLSRISDSLLMWSHYSDQYAGAVIEFDGSHEFFTGQIEVEYRQVRPRRVLAGYLTGEPIPVSELCVKSKDWAYEHEVRIIRALKECERIGETRGFPIFVQHAPLAAIKSVTLGERTSIEHQREVYARIMETNIALKLAAVDHSGFGFRLEMIKFPVPFSTMRPMMSPRTAHIFKELPGEMGEIARWLIDNHPLSRMVNTPV
jgi:hypothetical protein